ncbi:MAG: 4Fe-4S dicluster domain-containing protein, partial [Thermodesulfobacteriota bacterium]
EGVGAEILPLAKKHGMGVIVMKPLSGGLLSTPRVPEDANRVMRDPIVAGSLKYILSNDAVSTIIPGVVSAREVEENAAVGDDPSKLSEAEERQLFEAISSLKRKFRYEQECLRCGYCQPCSQGILIPDVFQAYAMYTQYPDDLKYMGVELYQSLEIKPDECQECRECEEKCPAGLSIPERLTEVVELFATIGPNT